MQTNLATGDHYWAASETLTWHRPTRPTGTGTGRLKQLAWNGLRADKRDKRKPLLLLAGRHNMPGYRPLRPTKTATGQRPHHPVRSYPEASGNRYWPDVHMAHSPRPNRRPNIALGVAEALPLALLLMAEGAPTALPLALPLAMLAGLVAEWRCASWYRVATVNCRAPE